MKKKNFYIARDDVDATKKEQEKAEESGSRFQVEPFVSPYSGTRVKDITSFPYIKYGNRGSQYEGLRDKRKVSDQELIERYGTKFYEFKQIQGLRDEDEKNNPEILDQDLEEYSKEPYSEPYQNNEPEELGKLKDLPPADEEYDYYGKTYSKNTNIQREPELAPTRSIPPKTYNGFDTRNVNLPLSKKRSGKYLAPPLTILKHGQSVKPNDYSSVNYQKEIIDRTLSDFRIGGRVVHYTKGPTVTQFEVKLDAGVKVERVKSIARNLQMNLEGKSIRIEAPIPGKSTIGIEVPNIVQEKVMFGDLISRPEFLEDGNPLNVALGIDIGGDFITLDIASMPHALIAGTTGSGKSVCINTIINSILYKATPDQVRLILIDPKLIEFSSYEDIPHLATPVINDPKLATTALKWAVDEMQSRYELFKTCKCRDITSYNELTKEDKSLRTLPYIVIIIDELADLMFIAASSVEEYIQRLAQKARAAGIHLIMATQRPSTDVIKGPIKANIQTRIAFAVNSQVDSMTILDKSGADKLLGKGDMLYSDGVNEIRVQGAFISLEEINAVTDYIKKNYGPDFLFSKEELTQKMQYEENMEGDPQDDEYFPIIAHDVVENNNASINRIQKRYGIGFNRAQNIMTGLEELGIVSEGVAGKPRSVLVTVEELEQILNE
jgi:S-DNA-T family DNA segregation ATPase FtsK/SpoIIIE